MHTTKAPKYKEGPWWSRTRPFFNNPIEFSRIQSATYGPIFETPFPFKKVFVVCGSEEIQQVLQAQHKRYVKSPFYNALKLALGNGLLTSEGDFWKHQRKLVQPAFYKSALDGLFVAMQEESISFVEDLKKRTSQETHFDLSKEMMRVTANIVLQTLFSSDTELGREEMYRMMVSLQEYVMMRALQPYKFPIALINGTHRQFIKDRRMINDSLYKIIDERLNQKDPVHDLLSLMVFAEDSESGQRMSREAVRDELITLFAAGHETSANALTWTLFLLGRNPDKKVRLLEEIDSVLAGRTPKMEDLFRMPYTRAVIEEGMRLYPPAYAVGRMAAFDTEIGGFEVPKDSIIYLSIYALHRDPKIFESPDAFQPERFLPDAPDIPKNAYIPFGFGPRKCVGYQFAMMEMQLLLPMLVQSFNFKFPDKTPENQILITLRPKGGMPVEIEKRILNS
ncbi:MAG: cytochrome P450 [Saprospiraceae bacterium]|nr:cytochrome P450 [Saprospiraceae bacterium]